MVYRLSFVFNHIQVDTKENEVPPTLVTTFAASVIGTFAIALIIGISLGLLCGIKYMQKRLNRTISDQNSHVPEENAMRSMKCPVYEEVKLENEAATIDLSQNIAYEQVKKTLS